MNWDEVNINAVGDVVAVSDAYFNTERGIVRVYQNLSGVWTQVGSDLLGQEDYEWFGAEMSLSKNGNRIAISAPSYDSERGRTKVFENQGGNWVQLGSTINGDATGDTTDGMSVSLNHDGTIMAIGAATNEGNDPWSSCCAGHARVFAYNTGNWTQLGSDIDGIEDNEGYGSAVALSATGTILAIGIPNRWDSATGDVPGGVEVYEEGGLLNISEASLNSEIKVYPNPTTGKFSILFPRVYNDVNVIIKNILGQIVSSYKTNTINNRIPLEIKNTSGVYIIEITNILNEKATFKIIKK